MAIQSLTHDELLALLRCARAKRERDWLLLLVAYNHALRVSEVIQLTANSVQDGFITVPRLKGSFKTVQPLIEDSEPLLSERDALIEYVKTRLSGQSLFNVKRRRVHQLMQEYGAIAEIPAHKRHPHVLKHSLCSYLVGKVPVEVIREWAGHRSLSSTGFYTRISPDEVGRAVQGALRV